MYIAIFYNKSTKTKDGNLPFNFSFGLSKKLLKQCRIVLLPVITPQR